MKISKGYGHGNAITIRTRFFTIIIHWHKKSMWKRHKERAK